MIEPPDLDRFLIAQEFSYAEARSELLGGKKQSHWMWFIFPQIEGLGLSDTARHYAISGADEAAGYLSHPVLGKRLVECCNIILELDTQSPEAVFGDTDSMKLRSSMTLFAGCSDNPVFAKVLSKYFGGQADPATLKLLHFDET